MSIKAYEHQEGQPEPSTEFLTQERPAREFDVVVLGAGHLSPHWNRGTASRLSMVMPNHPKAESNLEFKPKFKLTDACGGRGVICKVEHPRAQSTRCDDFALPPMSLHDRFFGVRGGVRGAMFPDAPKADFKATDACGGMGVINKDCEPTVIADFKLTDIPGVRHGDV